MEYSTIKITALEAEKILFELYNIKGKASSLPGYVDFNFRIKIENEEGYILNVLDFERLNSYSDPKYAITQIYHMAAILSASGEKHPKRYLGHQYQNIL